MGKKELLPEHQITLDEVLYELRSLKSPTLRGWLLKIFCLLIKSPVWHLLYRTIAWRSGIPQVVRDLVVPEPPLYRADLPLECAASDEELCKKLGIQTVVVPSYDPVATTLQSMSSLLSAAPRSSIGPPSILDYHAAYKAGTCTPTDIIGQILSFLDTHNSHGTTPLHWFLFYGEGAREAAAASSARWKEGRPLGLLDGVPFAVKDNLHVAEYPTLSGLDATVAGKDGFVDGPGVAALRSQGAIVVGKTVMHELGISTLGINPHHGTPANPWGVQHVCGGSSTGSAAAVGAGLVPFALGSDGGGSIRVPAALCGAYGLMPTQFRVPRAGQGSKGYGSVLSIFAITNCVADTALVLSAMSNTSHERGQERSPMELLCTPPVPPLRLPSLVGARRKLDGLRVGVYTEWVKDSSPEVYAAFQSVLDAMVTAGAQIVEVKVPDLELVRVAHIVTIASETLQGFRWAYDDPSVFNKLGLDVQISFKSSSKFTSADFVTAQSIRARATMHLRRVFKGVHMLATPTTPITAPKLHPGARSLGESNLSTVSALMRFMQLANFLGLPAFALPCGFDSAGLPISFHLMAPPWHECSLLAVASRLEAMESISSWMNGKKPQVECSGLHTSLQ